MQCFNCGTENPQEATFCKKCGRKLDGTALCSACGKYTPADGEFCIHCGSNRNAPVWLMPARFESSVPAAGGAEAAPAATAAMRVCAPAATAQPAPRDQRQIKAKVKTDAPAAAAVGMANGIMGKIALILSAVGALIPLIFVFLIGNSYSIGAGGVSGGSPMGYSIFHYFGDAYKSVFDTQSVLGNAALMGAVIGTVCSVVAIGGTAAAFAFTAVRAVKIFKGKADGGLLAPAATTYAAYVGGAALVLVCMAQRAELAGVSTAMVANIGTVAGIVLGGIVILAACVLSAISQGMGGNIKLFAVNAGSKCLYAVFAFAAIGLAGGCAAAVSVPDMDAGFTYGIATFLAQVAALGSDAETVDAYNGCLAVEFIFTAVLIALCAAAALAFGRVAALPGSGIDKRTGMFMLISGDAAVVAGVIMIVASSIYVGRAGSTFAVGAGIPVGVIICGLAMIAATVGGNIAAKKISTPVQAQTDN